MAVAYLSLVFLRKNFLYLRCNCQSVLTIFLACGFLLFGCLKLTVKAPVNKESYQFETKNYQILKSNFPANDFDWIYYTPITSNVDTIMELLREELEIHPDRLRMHNNTGEMQLAMEEECRGNCFAIDFQRVPDRGTTGQIKYYLSSNQVRISPKKRFVNDEEINHQKDDDEYIRSGFLTLQYIIDHQYMKFQQYNDNYAILLSSMPNLEVSSTDSNRFIYFGTLFSILFNVLLLSTFLVPYVEEKQDGLKEFLNLVTPMSFLNGLTFFVVRFICYGIFLIITMTSAWHFKSMGLIPFGYVFTLYVLFVLAAMSYAYLISVCFHSVFYAKVGGLVLLMLPYAFSFVRSSLSKLAIMLFSTNTFLEGLDVFQTFSNKHRSFTGSDLFRIIKDDSSRIFTIYIVLIMQTILYALLYNYFVCVFPGPGGLKRPFLFFLNPAFYKKRQRNEYTTSPRGTDAIIITNLCKKFQTSKRDTIIADHLDMTIKNKEITVLLGHNGVGKTTMMNMIMGLVPNDMGKIVVCSERDVSSYRHLIGFCPQHSVFMSYMTCKQHLVFFAQLRGSSPSEAKSWADEKLLKLKLDEKSNEYGKNLSGGMKRRLSLGIALAGNTKIVILDEPSSGLDIKSRRELWHILLNLRKEKAILVTTHYMEEAEVLGDTICILANGHLQCSGSPLELKRKSGNGYRLKLLTLEDKFKQPDTMQLICEMIPNASLLNIVKPTVNICLPYNDKGKFYEMLQKLESCAEQLGIETISITDTTMEDVFLNCASEFDQVDTPDGVRNDAPLLTPYVRLKDCHVDPKLWQLWLAIFYKKATFLYNEWIYACIMLCIPIVGVISAIVLMHSLSVVTYEDELAIKLSEMRSGVIYLYNPTGHYMQLQKMLQQQIELNGISVKMLTLRGSNSIRDEFLALQEDNLADYLEQVIGAIDMYVDGEGINGTPTLNLYYASNRCHSSVMLINLVDTTLLKFQSAESDIATTYMPIRRFITEISPGRLEYYPVIVSVVIFFNMSYYIFLPFGENTNGFKQLQAMSCYTFWAATFVFDMLQHLCLCLLLLLLQALIMPTELYNKEELATIMCSIFFYGCSYLPILYCLANSLKSISTISTYLLLMLIVSAIVPLITSANAQAMKLYETSIFFLRFLPDFNLNNQLRIVNENFLVSRRSGQTSILSTSMFFWYAVIVGLLVFAFFIVFLEDKYRRQVMEKLYQILTCQLPTTNNATSPQQLPPSEDCALEEKRVDDLLAHRDLTENHSLIVSKLRKQYKEKIVVNDLSFIASRGECFGLLGVNGAGKTTTFQMIAANLPLNGGSIQIDNIEIRQNEVAYRYHFGYCPQYDALNKFMTAEQNLLYMGRLRGLVTSKSETQNLQSNVEYWLSKMNLLKYRHVQVRHYSGGTKRKLLAAMAMIGGPPLVLLDEPTTGVDPVSRRFLWKCIKEFQSHDKTVVLSSHSMDECEELCNRLAIMVEGKFKCLNNICALKRSSGFTIKLKMTDENFENEKQITSALNSQFSGLELRENHGGMLTYFVTTDSHIIWSNVFKITEQYLANNLRHLIDDYSVNECSLEDIFLKYDAPDIEIPCRSVSIRNSNCDYV